MQLELKAPPGVLGGIVERTLADVAERRQTLPRARLEAMVCTADAPRPFADALRAPGLSLIAEYKPRSPSRGAIRPGVTPEDIAPAYRPHAAAVSVLIDWPFFGGSYAALRRMRKAITAPVIAKGFFVTPYQVVEARAMGADAILLMASLLPPKTLAAMASLAAELGLGTLVETHDEAELAEALASDAAVVGVNSRDLTTLEIDLDGACRLLEKVPADRVRVAESGLLTAADIERVRPLADAVLIGTALMRADDPAAQIAALGLAR